MYYKQLFIPYKYTRRKINKLQIIFFGILYATLWSTSPPPPPQSCYFGNCANRMSCKCKRKAQANSPGNFITYISTTHTSYLTLYLLTWRVWWAPNNASKGQMGFNLAFKGLRYKISKYIHTHSHTLTQHITQIIVSCVYNV